MNVPFYDNGLMMIMLVMVVVVMIMFGARFHHALNMDIYRDLASMLERKRQRKTAVLFKRLVQLHEHDVIAAGLQHGLPLGRNLNMRHLAHAHDVAVLFMGMQLGLA